MFGNQEDIIIDTQEKKTTGNLIAFIDLLFLVVCLFVFLVHQMGKKAEVKEIMVETIKEELLETAEKVQKAREKIAYLQPLAEVALKSIEERQKEDAKRILQLQRFQTRPVMIISYLVTKEGKIVYKNQEWLPEDFFQIIIKPMRKNAWISFRAYAPADVSFGKVIEIRQKMLQEKGEFDTFWSNLQKEPIK